MENEVMIWCRDHGAKLIRCTDNGFYYTNCFGDWYMSYAEMETDNKFYNDYM